VINDGWMSNVDANWDAPGWGALQRAFGRRARVIMFDRRGFGISDRPSSPEAMTLEIAMDDMRQVMDATGAEKAIVYGMEAGAAVSLLFAASFPGRVTGLVLQAPLVRTWRSEDFPWGLTEADVREWDDLIDRLWGTEEFWRLNFEGMGERETEPAVLRAWAEWSRLCASPQAALAIDQVERHVDVRALLPQVRVPTLVLQAEHDRDDRLWGATPWIAERIPGARYFEIPNAYHIPKVTDTAAFDEIDRFVAGIREQEAEFDRVLGTVLFTDVVGSTERAAAVGDRAWRELVERHHATVRALLARYRGVEMDTAGDGFFATFDGPARAVRCAEAIVGAVRSLGLEVRAGVHTGEIQTIDGKAGGLAVVIGARVGGLASASEVLVSQTVKDLVAGSGLVFEDAGEHDLKGVPDRWRLYSVVTQAA
jgi:pimeloyl-ACP methyl ester carboxylesterase